MSRARVISLVARMPGATQTDLAREMRIETPSMKRLLDGLEETGFVRRCPVEGNRRANGIHLTDRATAEAAALIGFVDGLAQEVFADVGTDDLAAATRLMNRISDRLAGVAE